jgi:hypothetical protein
LTGSLAFAAGLAVGLIVALRIKPATETSCCRRVAEGVRERVGTKCGPVCQSIGDTLGIWPATPGLLDHFGV